MNRSLATILVMAATSAALPAWADGETSADVLVWFVDTSEAEDGVGATFDEIKFWAVDPNNQKIGLGGSTYGDAGALLGGDSSGLAGSGESIIASVAGESFDGPYYTDISGYTTGYSFLMELYLGGERGDWMLVPVTLADIEAAAGAAAFHLSSMSDLDIVEQIEGYNFASTMIPEPSSNLLLLIGGALLALRRRRT